MKNSKQLHRFWDEVTIRQNEQQEYQIFLDQRPITLPQKSILAVPNLILAERIAQEWKNVGSKKGDIFSFEQLPLTQIMGTMIEKISPNRQLYIDTILPYMNGDLLCYRSETPKKLFVKQEKLWNPLIDWAEDFFQFSLKTTIGVMPITQEDIVNQTIRHYLSEQNNAVLTIYAVLVPLLGSIIITTALINQKITSETAFELAYLDELTQSEIWGYDSEQHLRLNKIKQNIQEAVLFLELFNSALH